MLMTGAGVRAWRRGGDDGEVHGAENHLLQILHQILPLLFFEFQRVFQLDPPPVPVPLHASAADHGSAQLRLLRVAQEIALPELHLRAPTIPAEQVQNPICVFFGCTASMSEVVRASGEGSDLLGVSFMRCKCVGSLSSFKCFRLGIPEPPVVGQRTTPGASTDAERRAPQKRQRPNLRSQKRVDREAPLRSPFWVNALRTPKHL